MALVGAPPCPRFLLCLPVIEHSNPVSVLQIVRGADPVLGITIGLPSPRKPRTAGGPPTVAEEKSPFEASPMGLGTNMEP
jgi:hypothetical protein